MQVVDFGLRWRRVTTPFTPPGLDEANTELLRRGFRMSTVFGARRHEQFPDGLPWTCTLRYERRRTTIAFYTDPGLQVAPTVAEVLVSLFADAGRFQHGGDFIEFCGMYGYERDSQRSEWTYAACADAAIRLRHLLDDQYPAMAVLLGGSGFRADGVTQPAEDQSSDPF